MKKIFLFVIIFNIFFSSAQKRLLKGKVTDSLQQPLEFANLMAKPVVKDLPFVFAVTGENGIFEMKLREHTAYSVTVSFMGYQPMVFAVDSLTKPSFKHISLKPVRQDLDEVVINYQTPVKITSDSIVYNVKHFVKGDEHKLKAVLNKLPGVKVDKNGLITVMGKHITKVMVEGKDFFGGNSKLAVENIPADAVKSVQVIKDYNNVNFMQGLTDEQKTIINIKLKKGKKRFVFGDLQTGGNTQKNYIAKANLFYYSPHTNLSYIGNTNNTGEASLTYQDIRRFENQSTIFNNNFSYAGNRKKLIKYSNSDNFLSKNILFNALQWQQDFGNKWSLEAYTLYADEKTDDQNLILNKFLIEPEILQTKTNNKQTSNESVISKIKLVFEPKLNQYYDLNISLNKNFFRLNQQISNQLNTQTETFNNTLSDKDLDYMQSLVFYKKFSKKHIIRFFTNYHYQYLKPVENWQSEQQFLSNYIPWQPASVYELNQTKTNYQHQWNTLLKYYFKINKHNHLYFSLGNQYRKSLFRSKAIQKPDGQEYALNGFEDRFRLKINDVYTGVQYRFKIGEQMFTPGLYLHYFESSNSGTSVNYQRVLLLPELNYEGPVLSGNLNISYKIKTGLPETKLYTHNKLLQSFEQIYRGNPNLSYELYHQLSLHYSYFSFKKGVMFFSHIDSKRYLSSIKYHRQILDGEFYNTAFISHQPEQNVSLMNRFEKEWKKINLEITSLFSSSKNYDFINDNWIYNKTKFFVHSIAFQMENDKIPEMESGISWEYLIADNSIDNTVFQSFEPYINIQFSYKSFQFKTDLNLQFIDKNNSFQRTTERLNFSLFYRKKNKPFGFEFIIQNALNQEYKYLFSPSSYMLSHKYTYLMPRIFLLKFHYKL